MAQTLPLIEVLRGERKWPPPIWLMRQAGRYLPEYREIRSGAGSFLDLCYDPDLAAEVTLQPIRRYGLDAAIIFADILLVAEVLGQSLRFEEGEGPILEPALKPGGLGKLSGRDVKDYLAPVLQTVRQVKSGVPAGTAVIGFCGAPWTVATYMATGRSPKEHLDARLWAYRDRPGFQDLIDRLVEVSAEYLIAQIEAGADAVKIFDSWAGVLPEGEFQAWVVEPTRRLIGKVKSAYPDVPVIGFPRGAGLGYRRFVAQSGADAVALDHMVQSDLAVEIQARVPVQGNVDPVALLAGGTALDDAVDGVTRTLGTGPLVFNLGHGVNKETPPENVARLVRRVRATVDPKG